MLLPIAPAPSTAIFGCICKFPRSLIPFVWNVNRCIAARGSAARPTLARASLTPRRGNMRETWQEKHMQPHALDLIRIGLFLSLWPAAMSAAFAQAYPAKAVRIVVPFAAGGGVDLTARILAQRLSERIGQSVIVDNRVGASGIIGTEYVAKSNPDGYTLLVGSQTSQAVVPAMYTKLN